MGSNVNNIQSLLLQAQSRLESAKDLKKQAQANGNYANANKGILKTRIIIPIGNPVPYCIKVATPLAPPGAILLGAVKHTIPIAYRSVPKTLRTVNLNTVFPIFSPRL